MFIEVLNSNKEVSYGLQFYGDQAPDLLSQSEIERDIH